MIEVEGPSPLGVMAVLGLVALGSIRKQTAQAGEANQKAALLHAVDIISCLPVPALFEFLT